MKNINNQEFFLKKQEGLKNLKEIIYIQIKIYKKKGKEIYKK